MVVSACILMSDVNHALYSQQRKTKPVSWLGSTTVIAGMLGCLAWCWHLTVGGWEGGLNCVSGLPAVCLNKVLKPEHSPCLMGSCKAAMLLWAWVNSGSWREAALLPHEGRQLCFHIVDLQ